MSNRRGVAALFCWLLFGGTCAAWAHESRPASLEITESPGGSVEVIWKRPLQAGVGLHLIPHLSSGWLDRDPGDSFAASDYLITSWRLPASGSRLSGQTLSVDGLAGTITDALVRVRFANGAEQDGVLRGQSPNIVLRSAGETPAVTGRFRFVELGMLHILSGPDHLLFVLGLVLIVANQRKLIATITGFTMGHTVTLIAASLLRLTLAIALIDLLIALSILFLGPEILRAQAGSRSLTTERPWVVASAFGLLHGLGFAAGMAGVGLRGLGLITALLQFNVGVELAQIAYVTVVLGLMALIRLMPFRWPDAAFRIPAYSVGVAGAVWAIQRGAVLFGLDGYGSF